MRYRNGVHPPSVTEEGPAAATAQPGATGASGATGGTGATGATAPSPVATASAAAAPLGPPTRVRATSSTDWKAVELLAVELASLAGAEITAALSRALMVKYKGAPGSFRDPVSEVDRNVETLIRARLSEHFPHHTVIGEEFDAEPDPDRDVVWAIDPVDGTNNFINGFPWFSAAIGVLHQGRPMVGAIWCSTSHMLRPGVYHARVGGKLGFEGQPVRHQPNPSVRRKLAGFPGNGWRNTPWDNRRTGSAAMECALVAAGPLQLARFDSPFVWDVAGGVALALAAGRTVRVREKAGWVPFESFAVADRSGRVAVGRQWRKPLLIGDPALVDQACELTPATGDQPKARRTFIDRVRSLASSKASRARSRG